ncbi:unnamed protein product [Ambrosiozyma monospora]|uniref:Unnamed protein product n=1 Tax=Ambrosiozyma monospora TaxID=43982 RepID=A0ACB5U3S0_AMBMO|nr:unnamed protein product [Ambrosiozyma monospora]
MISGSTSTGPTQTQTQQQQQQQGSGNTNANGDFFGDDILDEFLDTRIYDQQQTQPHQNPQTHSSQSQSSQQQAQGQQTHSPLSETGNDGLMDLDLEMDMDTSASDPTNGNNHANSNNANLLNGTGDYDLFSPSNIQFNGIDTSNSSNSNDDSLIKDSQQFLDMNNNGVFEQITQSQQQQQGNQQQFNNINFNNNAQGQGSRNGTVSLSPQVQQQFNLGSFGAIQKN